jgi:hypothetical protein
VGESGNQAADWCAPDALEGVGRQALRAGFLSGRIRQRCQLDLFFSQKANCRACDTVPAVPEKTNRVVDGDEKRDAVELLERCNIRRKVRRFRPR